MLVERLNAVDTAWVRLAANKPGDEWQLAALEVVLGERPPHWEHARWEYERAIFIAAVRSGSDVAAWIENQRIELDSFELPLTISSNVNVDRRDSRFTGLFEILPWPSVNWAVSVTNELRQMLQGELVAGDAPLFLDFDVAGLAFFSVTPTRGGRGFSGSEFVVRDQDLRGRIDAVRVRPTEVVVEVSGNECRGLMLTLGGRDSQRHQLPRDGGEFRFPLGEPLPPRAWVALHRDRELLDRRVLDPSWGRPEDVEFELDSASRAELLVSTGEDARKEFKLTLPEQRSSIENAMKTVAAFANADGGTLLFGVDNEMQVVGLGVVTQADLDRLAVLVRDWVHPRPPIDIQLARVGEASIVVLDVESGEDAPYGVGSNDRSLTYYFRSAGTTSPASPDEIRSAVRARITPQSGYRI